jgi:AraC-like DNA-binding protein
MAGMLHDKSTIQPNKMRILGRYVLILVLEGPAFYEDNTTRKILKPGDAILVHPELPHAYGSPQGHPWKQIYIVFDGPQFDMLYRSETFNLHLPVWHLGPVAFWEQQLHKLFRDPDGGRHNSPLASVSRFSHLLVEMATSDAKARGPQPDDWMEESLRLLGEMQKDEWLSPQKVARQLGMSYESFRKAFAARRGHPPGHFQQQRRIDQACASIYRGTENFKELAERLGFCDVYHFPKVFRKFTGVPPSSYRRSVRGN